MTTTDPGPRPLPNPLSGRHDADPIFAGWPATQCACVSTTIPSWSRSMHASQAEAYSYLCSAHSSPECQYRIPGSPHTSMQQIALLAATCRRVGVCRRPSLVEVGREFGVGHDPG